MKPTDVYSTENTISLGYETHRKISKIYSSGEVGLSKFIDFPKSLMDKFLGSKSSTFRKFMSDLEYPDQLEYGKELLKYLGVNL